MVIRMNSNKSFKVIVAVALPLALLCVAAWAVFVKMPLPCVIYRTWGIYCPSCGATRAIISMLEGDFCSAFEYNACVTVMIIPAIMLGLYLYFGIIFGYLPSLPKSAKVGIAVAVLVFAVLFFAFGVLRNLPTYPFLPK